MEGKCPRRLRSRSHSLPQTAFYKQLGFQCPQLPHLPLDCSGKLPWHCSSASSPVWHPLLTYNASGRQSGSLLSTTNAPAVLFLACDALPASCLQLGASLAQQRRQLTLFRHPLLTLYYLVACASAAAWRGVKWCLKHPIMLFIIVPVLATYLTLKSTGLSGMCWFMLEACSCSPGPRSQSCMQLTSSQGLIQTANNSGRACWQQRPASSYHISTSQPACLRSSHL